MKARKPAVGKRSKTLRSSTAGGMSAKRLLTFRSDRVVKKTLPKPADSLTVKGSMAGERHYESITDITDDLLRRGVIRIVNAPGIFTEEEFKGVKVERVVQNVADVEVRYSLARVALEQLDQASRMRKASRGEAVPAEPYDPSSDIDRYRPIIEGRPATA